MAGESRGQSDGRTPGTDTTQIHSGTSLLLPLRSARPFAAERRGESGSSSFLVFDLIRSRKAMRVFFLFYHAFEISMYAFKCV